MIKSLRLSRSLLICAVVTLGIAAAWAMVAAWTISTAGRMLEVQEPYENIYTSVSGEPVIVRTSRGNTQTTENILSLSGEPAKVTSQDLLHPQTIDVPGRRYGMPTRLDWQSRLASANDGGIPPVYWYMIHDGQTPGHAYGVGYHSPTRTVVGYFGRGGFRDSLPPRDDWFAIAGHDGMQNRSTFYFYGQEPQWASPMPRGLLLADGKLWKIDFANRQVAKMLDCPEAYAVGHVWRILPVLPPRAAEAEHWSASSITPTDALLREPESVLIVDKQSSEARRFALPPLLRNQMLAGALLPDESLLVVAQRSWSDGDSQVVWLKSNGEIIKQQTVHRRSIQQQPSLAVMGWTAAASLPWTLASAVVTFIGLPMSVQYMAEADADVDYQTTLIKVLGHTWPSILAVIAVGCVTAVLAYRRQKRFGLPYPAAWAVFVFVFGLPGWIAYRFHRVWPVLEECPACRQPAPRDRERCLDCGKAFPPPTLKGIEVFA